MRTELDLHVAYLVGMLFVLSLLSLLTPPPGPLIAGLALALLPQGIILTRAADDKPRGDPIVPYLLLHEGIILLVALVVFALWILLPVRG